MTVVGTIELIASIDTSKYKKGAKEVDDANDDMERSANKSSSGITSSLKSTAKIGFGALIGAAVAAGAAIISNVDNAIKRVDTLKNSSRTFENLGFSADSVQKAMSALEKSIQGLPTSLDESVRGVQLLAASTGDIGKSQKIFSALNNAIIGFGGTSDDVSGVIRQFSQALAGGKIDAETYNSFLDNGLGATLVAIGKLFGKNSKELKEGLSDGSISIDQFNDALIKLNTEGGGGMRSLEKIAKDSTSGISTGFDNANTAVARGIAAIIQTIGQKSISDSISGIGTAFENALKGIANGVKFISDNKDVFTTLAVGIGAATAALVLFNLALAVQEWVAAFGILRFGTAAFLQLESASKLVTAAQWAFNVAIRANPIGIIVTAVIAAVAALVYFFTQTETGKKIVQVAFTVISKVISDLVKTTQSTVKGILGFFDDLWKGITDIFNTITGFFNGVFSTISDIFTNIVNFFKQWGLTILAIMFFPFAILLGLIFKFKNEILGFFTAIYKGIVAIVTPIVDFFVTIFTNIYNAIVAIITPVIGFIGSVFIAAWNMVTMAFGAIGEWFGARWNEVVAVFSVVSKFFGDVFTAAWNNIKAVFSTVGSFFRGVWNTIVGLFGNVGNSVGDAIGGAFKNVINGVLRFAVNVINGFIDAINVAIGIVNNIPGVKIGKLGKLPVPQLAEGGIVTSPTLAMIGEGRESEAVIPLSKLDEMMNGNSSASNVTVTVSLSGVMTSSKADERAVAVRIGKLINEALTAKGQDKIGAL